MTLNYLSIKEARQKLDQGEITCLALTQACLLAIAEKDPVIQACLMVDKPGALKAAERADERIQRGERGPLLGIPYLAKDILMTKGLKTTAASKILKDYIAPFNATVIERLETAGAILLGKTNLDEFAHGCSTENSAFFASRNPYDLTRTPGGSSGGSAAAVAAGLCLFSLGTDTGGSIRQPASFCNLVGLKPSYGRVSRFGLMAMTSSTDVIGPLTKTIEEAAWVLSVIAGPDKQDTTCLQEKVVDYTKYLTPGVKGLKVGWPKQYFNQGLDKGIKRLVKKAADCLVKQGAKLVEIDLKYADYSVPAYYIITPSEISSNLARFDGIGWGLSNDQVKALKTFYLNNRGLGFGQETKRRIMLGTFALSAGYADQYYKQALAVREKIRADFKQAFTKVDILLSPTVPNLAFKLGAKIDDPLSMYLEDVYLAGASLAGLPALSMPAGWLKEGNKKLPVGLQLIAPPSQEGKLLQVAKNLEENNN